MTYFNYYQSDIHNSRPLGTVNLSQFFQAIKNPKPHIREIFQKIKQADKDGNNELKAQLKTSLYSFTPCVLINDRRCYADIKEFTGLMMLDFDKIDNAQEFKEFLFNTYPFVIAAWLSASGRGVRALVNIPIVKSIEEFKSYFHGIRHYEMDQYNGFDIAPQNCVLPLFLSYDPDIYYGDTSEVWDQKYNPPIPPPIPHIVSEENPSRVEKIIKSAIDKIHDNGHPQLRAASFVLGGYVGSGAIDQSHAVELINSLIHSNSYLSIKPEVYKRTAKTMIEKGIEKPVYL